MSDLASIYDDINHIDAMKDHLVIQKQQYEEITEKVGETERAYFQLSQRIQGVKDRIYQEETKSRDHSPILAQQLAELEKERDGLLQEKQKLIRRKKDLNEDIVLQEQAIAGEHLKYEVSFSGLLQHQENIKTAEQEIKRLEQLISEQIPAIRSLLVAKTPINGLLEQQEDILAEIAHGANLEAELHQVEQQIIDVHAKIDQAEEQAHKAEATQEGLKRKLTKARQDLAELHAKTPCMREMLLNSMAESEGQRYFELAEQLQRSYARLMGLDGVIKQHDPKRKGICIRQPELMLPTFNLKVAEGYRTNKNDGYLFDWRAKFFYGNGQMEAMSEELNKIRKAGITVI